MSQFDALLDFDDNTTTETNGTSQHAAVTDDFDPFGPTPTIETKGSSSEGGNLLVDFSVETEISNDQPQNGVNEPFDDQFEVTTSEKSSNLLFDMSSGANPLYELSADDGSSTDPTNPLYEFSNNGTQEEGLLITTTTTTSSSTSASASNPLYDFVENGDDENSEVTVVTEKVENGEGSLITITETTTVTSGAENGVTLEDNYENIQSQQLLDLEPETQPETAEDYEPEAKQEPEPVAVEEDAREIIPESSSAVEAVADTVVDETDRVISEEVQERNNRSRSLTRSPSSSDDEAVVKEGQQVTQDGVTVSKTNEEKTISGVKGDAASGVGGYTDKQYDSSGDHYQVMSEEYVNSSYRMQENGMEEEVPRDPNVVRETKEKEDFHFSGMTSVKTKFEEGPKEEQRHIVDVREEYQHTEGGEYESTPEKFDQWQNSPEGGIYENEPEQRTDVVSEKDRNIEAELPEIGMARNLKAKFVQMQSETTVTQKRREMTPPDGTSARVEYVSEPRDVVDHYEGKAEAGVFENQPTINPDVVRSGEGSVEDLPERGMAKNLAARFKQFESNTSEVPTPKKREITPDRTGKVEFVSEPRGYVETYEGKAESGIFESQPELVEDVIRAGEEAPDILPEKGAAKNMAAKFRMMQSESTSPPSAGGKREITPDRTGRVEFVSEPRGYVEKYEGKAEAGVFENRPMDRSDVVKADEPVPEEPLPERGYTRNVAAKFKELESQAKSPPNTPGRRKEFTPPREEDRTTSSMTVYENQPQMSPEVAREGDQSDEILPQRGTAKSMATRFRQLSEENKTPTSRGLKEFTPPRDTGSSQAVNAGVFDNQPEIRTDVAKETDSTDWDKELPERGMARNIVSRFRQLESESAKKSPPSSQKVKEFTPPRDEPRVAAARSPKTPLSPHASSGHVNPGDLPGQYQPQTEPNVFESQPEQRPDVIREADTDWQEGMPAKNTTKAMLNRFKQIQADANKEQPKPISRKDESDGEVISPDREVKAKKGGIFKAVQSEKCGACQKTVYAMERLEMNKTIYHKGCFRCSQCRTALTPKTFAVNNGTIFCTAHYKQLFARKGNYDEGFGREQHKKRWRSEPNLSQEPLDNCDDSSS